MENKVTISSELFEDPEATIVPPAARDERAYLATIERVGVSPEERLRWLLEFIQKEPSTLSIGEKLDLLGELYVFVCANRSEGPGTGEDYQGFNFVYLRMVQEKLKKGISHFVSQGSWQILLGTAATAGSRPMYLLVRGTDKKIYGHFIGDYLSCAMLIAADLLKAEGERIRVCHECKKIFLPVKRQEYCGSQCSQKVRTRKYRDTHQVELSKRRHQEYERQIHKKPGLRHAKVGTQRKRNTRR